MRSRRGWESDRGERPRRKASVCARRFRIVITLANVQRVIGVHEALPVGQQVTQAVLVLGRGVDDLPRAIVAQRRPRLLPNPHLHPFDAGGDCLSRPRAEGELSERAKPIKERFTVAKGLAGGSIRAIDVR